jgi:hypothetical protein
MDFARKDHIPACLDLHRTTAVLDLQKMQLMGRDFHGNASGADQVAIDWARDGSRPSVATPYASDDPQERVWYQLQRLIQDFGKRQFTVQGDVHDAFSAVLEECASIVKEPFLWGLPASARFELALCWEPFREALTRRPELTTLPITSLKRRVPFPSCSWMGWDGSVTLRVEDRYTDEGYGVVYPVNEEQSD